MNTSVNKEESKDFFSRKSVAWFKGFAIIMVILSHYAEWWSWFYVEEGILEQIRYICTRLGDYGVSLFFLFSAYGLAKSVGDKRVDLKFVLKRIINVYIPYLVVVILIKMLSGGFATPDEFLDIFYGQSFWYMTVIFSFYIAFMVIWFITKNRHLRAALMIVFTYAYSYYLYSAGNQDFWYTSNTAFAIGGLIGLYEAYIKKVTDKAGIMLTIVLGIASLYNMRWLFFGQHAWADPLEEIRMHMISIALFALFIALFACVWKWYDPILRRVGKYSLYFYLSHTFIFMWAVNYFTFEISMRFLVASVLIIIASLILGIIMDFLSKPVLKRLSAPKQETE